MQAVPLSFFHVLVMLSAGGLLTSLAAHLRTPLARGYLLFNGAVLLVFLALGLWLRLALPLPSLLPYDARAPWVAYEPVLWLLFAALLVAHLLLVRVERARLATWVGLVAGGVGLASLADRGGRVPAARDDARGALCHGSAGYGGGYAGAGERVERLDARPLVSGDAAALAAAVAAHQCRPRGRPGRTGALGTGHGRGSPGHGAGGDRSGNAAGPIQLVVRAAGGYRRGVSAGPELDDLADGAHALDDGGHGPALYRDGSRGERRDHRPRAVFHRSRAGMSSFNSGRRNNPETSRD